MEWVSWQKSYGSLVLENQAVHLWCIDIKQILPYIKECVSVLSEEEMKKAECFVYSSDYQRYVIAHGVLRKIFSLYSGVAPQVISFSKTDHGKPFVAGEAVQFNMSHSQDRVLYAFSQNIPLGVDIEWLGKEVDAEALAERFFTQDEFAQLRQFDKSERLDAFIRAWVLKESYIKKKGQGLAYSLQNFTVDLYLNEQWVGNDTWLKIIDVGPNYLAALALPSEATGITCWNMNKV